MQEELVSKMKETLDKSDYSEKDIVYFLVQAYKLLEIKDKTQSAEFRVIKFYRNWVCHAFLSRDTKEIFGEVYDHARQILDKTTILVGAGMQVEDEIERAFSRYSFIPLKRSIEEFSKQFLDNIVFNWGNFRVKIYSVLVDIPLKIREDEETVFEFSLKKCDVLPDLPANPHDLSFEVVVGGHKFSFDIDDFSLLDEPICQE